MLIAKFPDGISEITVNGLHQWNYGQQLQIEASDLPALFEVHFAYPGIKDAIVRVCAAVNGVATVAIPDECLEQSRTIQAWIYEIKETAGKTTKTIRLNVIKRVRPAAGGDIPREISDKYTEAIAAMNETIKTLESGNISVHKAKGTDVRVISSLEILQNTIIANPASSIGVCIRNETGISISTIYGETIFIPRYAQGTLTINDVGDASLYLTTFTGEVFNLFYSNNGYWYNGSKILPTINIKTTEALMNLAEDDTIRNRTIPISLGDATVKLINKYGTEQEKEVTSIPKWSKGVLVRADADSTLDMIDITGKHFTAYYDAGAKNWIYKYDTVGHATTADIINSKVIQSSGEKRCLIKITKPGIYIVNFTDDGNQNNHTATFFITDLTNPTKPGGNYTNFETVTYEYQGVSETGERMGYIILQSADKFNIVSAKMVCISQSYME